MGGNLPVKKKTDDWLKIDTFWDDASVHTGALFTIENKAPALPHYSVLRNYISILAHKTSVYRNVLGKYYFYGRSSVANYVQAEPLLHT